jgi:hypothetical protein
MVLVVYAASQRWLLQFTILDKGCSELLQAIAFPLDFRDFEFSCKLIAPAPIPRNGETRSFETFSTDAFGVLIRAELKRAIKLQRTETDGPIRTVLSPGGINAETHRVRKLYIFPLPKSGNIDARLTRMNELVDVPVEEEHVPSIEARRQITVTIVLHRSPLGVLDRSVAGRFRRRRRLAFLDRRRRLYLGLRNLRFLIRWTSSSAAE